MADFINITLTGDEKADRYLQGLARKIDQEDTPFLRSLATTLVSNVKRRITSENNGQWPELSKWTQAKKGRAAPPLLGAARYVKSKVARNILTIFGNAPGWTLTQHDEGFTNPAAGPNEERDAHGRVVLQIKDPRKLNLYHVMTRRAGKLKVEGTTFAFVPKTESRVPARKIWPTTQEATAIIAPAFTGWLRQMAEETNV